MAIKIVSIGNFTVFKDFHLNVSSGVNIIIGENGTGKTHLLKAIYSACGVTHDLNFGATRLPDIFSNIQEINLLHNKNEPHSTISLKISDSEKYSQNGYLSLDNNINYYFTVPEDKKLNAVYIPVKDVMTHSNGFLAMANTYKNFPFDKTLVDIVTKTSRWKVKNPSSLAISILPILESMMDGEVIHENDDFYIKKNNGQKIIFDIEAEGLKKIGLLWQLLMTNSVIEDSIILWDEPESNLNPKFLPKLAECLLTLSRNGIQIFLTTHNYLFAKYFDVLKNDSDDVKFHSLYFDDKIDGVLCESNSYFESLKRNDISNAFNRLLELVYDIKVGE